MRNNFEDPEFIELVAKELTRVSERQRLVRKNADFMRGMWTRSVKAIGKHDAKETMREIMGDKDPGPSKTAEDIALENFICAYIRHRGPKQGDGKIARCLLGSQPYFVQWDSGSIVVASDEFHTEINSILAKHPAVKRTPINKEFAALKKHVEPVRRRAIDDGLLPIAFAPKA